MTGRAPLRFRDDGRTNYSFFGEILVRCPKCSGAARQTARDPKDWTSRRKLVCLNCTYQSESDPRAIHIGSYVMGQELDPFFRLPLLLQTVTRHGPLYAYNAEHLAWLEDFVAAGLRERRRDEWGWSNRAITTRLPRWIKIAKNREEVLRALARLRAKLKLAGP